MPTRCAPAAAKRLGRRALRVVGDDHGGAVVPDPLDEQVEDGGSGELARLPIRARHDRRRRPVVERDADARQDGVTPGHATPTTRGTSARAAPGRSRDVPHAASGPGGKCVIQPLRATGRCSERPSRCARS